MAPVPPPLGGMAVQGQILSCCLTNEGVAASVVPTNPVRLLSGFDLPGVRSLIQFSVFVYLLLRNLFFVDVVQVFAASYTYFFLRVVPAVVLARLFRRRVIINYRGGEAAKFFAKYGRLALPIVRWADRITVPSRYLKGCFAEYGLASEVVCNIIDLDRFVFRPRDTLQPKLLVMRNLEPMYNVEMALDVFQIIKQGHPDARIDVVGSGSQTPRLKQWVQARGLTDVYFHGGVPHSEIPGYLDRAEIFLNPTNVDNLPMSLIEAFASGVPVVTTNVGGIPDLLDDSGAALTVEAGDARAMAGAVERLLNDSELAKSMVLAGRRLTAKYTWPEVRKQLVNVYDARAQFGESSDRVGEQQ